MKEPMQIPRAHAAILAFEEMKQAVDAFDRGETNIFDAVDSIIVAVEAYQAATRAEPHRDAA